MVEYLICVGEGFFITDDELHKLCQEFPEFVEDDDGDRFLHRVNQWSCDEGVFVGPIKGFEIDEFEPLSVPKMREVIPLDRVDNFKKWLKKNEEKFYGICGFNIIFSTHIFRMVL